MFIIKSLKVCLRLKILTATVFLGVCFSIQAQDPLFSQFMFRQLYHNPAYAGTTENARVMGGYRNQWPGMNNAFTTYYLTYDQNIPTIKSGLGFSVMRDVIGNSTFNVTGFDFNYNYQTELSRDMNISFGLSASVYQKARSLTSISQSPYDTWNDPEIIPGESKWYPDFGFGVYSYLKGKHWISLAVHHLNRPNASLNGTPMRLPMRFTFQYVTQIKKFVGKFTDKEMIYKPGIIYQQQSRYNYISAGSNFEYNPFIGGVWLRSDNNFSLESLILLVGTRVSNFTIVYSYDLRLINFSKNVINNGAHEVTFQLDFKYNERKKMRQVKCPKF